jgi:alanine transaminase
VLVPIPQYPLYTASLSVLDSKCVPYYLDESKNWGTNLDAIQTACKKAQDEGTDVRAIVIINPGNPTGGSLHESDIKAIIEFAAQENLVIMADEVYQTNVFIGKFHSFRGVLGIMQKENPGKFDTVELASLHSISKGMVGECGHRGGYFELVGFDKEVQEQIYKFVSISLCAPVVGQCLVEMMVNPPKEGEPSYELYKKEYNDIYQGLQKRATALYEAFKEMEGVECQDPQVPLLSLPLTDPLHAESLLTMTRDPCTFSRLSTFHPKLLKLPKRRTTLLMNSIVSVYWMQQASALSLVLALVKSRVRYISELLSWHRERSGWVELRSFIRSS